MQIKSVYPYIILFGGYSFFALGGSINECSKVVQTFQIPDSQIAYASYHDKGTSIPLPGTVNSCGGPQLIANITANLCRVVFDTTTSNSSSVHFEAWLPNNWNGRFLATGNGGIGGRIDHTSVQNGALMGFASLGMNAGHNGSKGYDFFLNRLEVLIEFGYRSMHVQAEVGKELIRQYYGHKPSFNYYWGCSTGGRQGFSSATHYPNDFDGLILGAPEIEWIRIPTSWEVIARRLGWPDIKSKGYVTDKQFNAIAQKTVELLDSLDGVTDGVIDNPTHFRIDPEIFSCHQKYLNQSVCLQNAEQIESVRAAYEPIGDLQGNIVYPAFELGSSTSEFSVNIFNGTGWFQSSITRDFYRGAVYNDTKWNDLNFSVEDVEYAINLNPARINTGINEAHVGTFKNSKGKIIYINKEIRKSIYTANIVSF